MVVLPENIILMRSDKKIFLTCKLSTLYLLFEKPPLLSRFMNLCECGIHGILIHQYKRENHNNYRPFLLASSINKPLLIRGYDESRLV